MIEILIIGGLACLLGGLGAALLFSDDDTQKTFNRKKPYLQDLLALEKQLFCVPSFLLMKGRR